MCANYGRSDKTGGGRWALNTRESQEKPMRWQAWKCGVWKDEIWEQNWRSSERCRVYGEPMWEGESLSECHVCPAGSEAVGGQEGMCPMNGVSELQTTASSLKGRGRIWILSERTLSKSCSTQRLKTASPINKANQINERWKTLESGIESICCSKIWNSYKPFAPSLFYSATPGLFQKQKLHVNKLTVK